MRSKRTEHNTQLDFMNSLTRKGPQVLFLKFKLQQHAGDRSRHKIGHGASQHRTNTQSCQFTTLIRSECADTADLDSDRTEVGESAQRECRDSNGAWIQQRLDLSEHGKCHEFVQNHPRAKQIAHRETIVRGNSNHPRYGRKNVTEY